MKAFLLIKLLSVLNKLSYIMEDVRIKYCDARHLPTTLEVERCKDNNIEVIIDSNNDSGWELSISLNKATAIQLVKRLKLEISKINQDG